MDIETFRWVQDIEAKQKAIIEVLMENGLIKIPSKQEEKKEDSKEYKAEEYKA